MASACLQMPPGASLRGSGSDLMVKCHPYIYEALQGLGFTFFLQTSANREVGIFYDPTARRRAPKSCKTFTHRGFDGTPETRSRKPGQLLEAHTKEVFPRTQGLCLSSARPPFL